MKNKENLTEYTPFEDSKIAIIFSEYPKSVRQRMLDLRELIFQTSATVDVWPVKETLKRWEPSYITPVSKKWTTIRIDRKEKTPNKYYIFFSCSTKLVSTFRKAYPLQKYEWNRAVVLDVSKEAPKNIVNRLWIKTIISNIKEVFLNQLWCQKDLFQRI